MSDRSEFADDYEERCDSLRDLGPVAEHLIQELLTAADIRVHSVGHRIKSKESVERKASRKDGRYDGLEQMHDLLGLRVITFFPDEVDRVAGVIESEFSIDKENSVDKRSLLDPDRFGYLSRHYVATLSAERAQLTEHVRFDGLAFEVQIRSILQHAWAEIEHDLGYHNARAVPDSVRRRFFRLAGLLEIADDEFQALRQEVAEYQSVIDEEVDKDPQSVPVDQDSIAAFIKSNEASKALDRYVADALSARLLGDRLGAAGSLAAELRWAGLETVAEVADALQARSATIETFVDQWVSGDFRRSGGTEVSAGISLFYLVYVLVAESGGVERILSYLEQANIGKGGYATRRVVAQRIFDCWSTSSGNTVAQMKSEDGTTG